ncbi:hypothetical protein [Histidinibacterium aquaticum]|uniref:Uncharacterized protein n=1 Tax=Histidinibacterium aquaticum TaxID=2613962 RepID=A0A5J5GJ54_9RHOB|nr:hypothetical protein [Histidinibacterium aquaticum]KAA9008271.1 hypothetical protein F3S47_12340 [Histidinibacterium aquaticum]
MPFDSLIYGLVAAGFCLAALTTLRRMSGRAPSGGPREVHEETGPLPEFSVLETAPPRDASAAAPAEPAETVLAEEVEERDPQAAEAFNLTLDIDPARTAEEAEVVSLLDPRDVLSLEFADHPSGRLHVVHGSARAQLDTGIASSAWIDVYLSDRDRLTAEDVGRSGEIRADLATHILRIDLGKRHEKRDGTVEGAINEEPEIYFDREVASEIDHAV